MGAGGSKAAAIAISNPATEGVPAALCGLYKAKVLPLEQLLDYEFYDAPYLYDAEFKAKPSVLFVGQYSVGKTTVIRYLVGEDIPGSRIGPEPTTDTFTFVTYGKSSRSIPGSSLMAEAEFAFRGLSKFGAPFLSKCNAATCPSQILKSITFIDTPGILSGEKQRVSGGYDFEQIISFLAEKVDRILLLFDAHKLDISDEFKRSIQALQGNEEKVKIVLNKVDSMEPGSLNRVIGALMWSLSKVLKYPEVPPLFIGSFWDRPIRYPQYREVIERDTRAVFEDLRSLPRTVNVRRINDVVKRARQVKVFAYVMDELAHSVGLFCKEQKKMETIRKLDNIIYSRVCLHHRVPAADLPSAEELRKKLALSDSNKWKRLDATTRSYLNDLDDFMNKDVTQLISCLPADSEIAVMEHGTLGTESKVFNGEDEFEWKWLTVLEEANKGNWQKEFEMLKPSPDGKLYTTNAKSYMDKSGLPSVVLAQIWRLVDVDNDNKITLDEFFLMNYLINRQISGKLLPKKLPASILPLSGWKPPSATSNETSRQPESSRPEKKSRRSPLKLRRSDKSTEINKKSANDR